MYALVVKGVCLDEKKLEQLKCRISEHFYNEARIMRDILKAKLTEEETDALVLYMENHPYAKLANSLFRNSGNKKS